MKRNLRNVAVAAAGVLAVFALMGEASESDNSSSGDNGGAVAAENSGDSGSSSAVGTAKDNPIPIGTPVEVAKDWTVVVNSVVLDANAQAAAANQFNTPDAGKQFVMANVSITNNSDTPSMAMSNLKVSMLPPSGVAVSEAFVAGLDAMDQIAQLQPGATITGNLIYQVPTAELAGTVLLAEPQFTMDQNEDQRFFAIQ